MEPQDLDNNALIDIHSKMLLTRRVGQRLYSLTSMGKGSLAVGAEGQEAVQVASAYALRSGYDWVYPYYRDIGVVIALGDNIDNLFLAHFARSEDESSGGRGLPMQFGNRNLRIVSGSPPIATQLPQAAGTALASKLRQIDEVTAVYFGDGATSAGDCHEAFNLAGTHKLPVVFVCENNRYAISVPWSKQAAIQDVACRAAGYGFEGITVDGNDVLEVYGAMKFAVDHARNGGGPTLLEAKTYRLGPHTSSDDDSRYRNQSEVEEWRLKDPISRFRQWLLKNGIINDGQLKELEDKVNEDVETAIERAERAKIDPPEHALRHVFLDL